MCPERVFSSSELNLILIFHFVCQQTALWTVFTCSNTLGASLWNPIGTVLCITGSPMRAISMLLAMWSSHLGGGFNTLRSRQNRHHFADNIFQCVFLNENCCILIELSLKFVTKCSIHKICSIGSDNGMAPIRRQAIIWINDGLVYWHIYVTRPQWVNVEEAHDRASSHYWVHYPGALSVV